MFADIIWFPSQASTTARSVDWLLVLLSSITGAVGLLVAVLLIGFSIRYRRRPGAQPPPADARQQAARDLLDDGAAAIFFAFFAWGAAVYFDAYRPPDDSQAVYCVGKQWMWKFQHPEGQREINELHVPVGQPVRLLMTSEDVIHSFYVPAFRVHQDVLPGRYTSVWFTATKPGEYRLFCSQYCGTNHAGMVGKVVALPPDEYQRWLELRAEGSLALQGRKTFLKYRCLSCHSADHDARGPVLEGVYGKTVRLRDGGAVVADEAYLRESILHPSKKVVAGYEDVMPTFAGQVTEEEVIGLIAWFRSLRPGETPKRNEQFPPPAGTPPIRPQQQQQEKNK